MKTARDAVAVVLGGEYSTFKMEFSGGKEETMTKKVYSISELTEIGYPVDMLRRISRSEHFSTCGFRYGNGRNSKIYFYREKLDKFLSLMTEVNSR